MTTRQMIQLAGLILGGIGAALRFTSVRPIVWRTSVAVGTFLLLAGTALLPELRDPRTWQDPAVYVGLVLGVGLPFLLAFGLLLSRRKRRRP